VLTEAAFLLQREGHEADSLWDLLDRGVIRIALDIQEEQADLRALMHRYRNRPMSLADACLVRLSELHATGEVFTLDSDFRILNNPASKVREGLLVLFYQASYDVHARAAQRQGPTHVSQAVRDRKR
jgi:hypothetical protein